MTNIPQGKHGNGRGYSSKILCLSREYFCVPTSSSANPLLPHSCVPFSSSLGIHAALLQKGSRAATLSLPPSPPDPFFLPPRRLHCFPPSLRQISATLKCRSECGLILRVGLTPLRSDTAYLFPLCFMLWWRSMGTGCPNCKLQDDIHINIHTEFVIANVLEVADYYCCKIRFLKLFICPWLESTKDTLNMLQMS